MVSLGMGRVVHNYMGKFAVRHRYFLAFAKTHRSIMSLPSTIIILWHICQNTPHSQNGKFYILLENTTAGPVYTIFLSLNVPQIRFGAKQAAQVWSKAGCMYPCRTLKYKIT
jgi:hypothetical protein